MIIHLFYTDFLDDYLWSVSVHGDVYSLEWGQHKKIKLIEELSAYYTFNGFIKWLNKNEVKYTTNNINHIGLLL